MKIHARTKGGADIDVSEVISLEVQTDGSHKAFQCVEVNGRVRLSYNGNYESMLDKVMFEGLSARKLRALNTLLEGGDAS